MGESDRGNGQSRSVPETVETFRDTDEVFRPQEHRSTLYKGYGRT